MSMYILIHIHLVYIQSSYGLANILFTFNFVANVCLHSLTVLKMLNCLFSVVSTLWTDSFVDRNAYTLNIYYQKSPTYYVLSTDSFVTVVVRELCLRSVQCTFSVDVLQCMF